MLIGLSLAGGGTYLSYLGGSNFYLLQGLATIGAGVLLWRLAERAAIYVYSLMLLVTIGWAFWEVGPDFWGLMPRLAGPLLFGLWLVAPCAWRAYRNTNQAWRAASGLGLAAILVIGGYGAVSALDENVVGQAKWSTNSTVTGDQQDAGEWASYGNTPGGGRFSQLTQINRSNIAGLAVAWTAHTGLARSGFASSLETTPIMVGDTLYLCTGYNDVLALDAETGRQRWRFHANLDSRGVLTGACRGVSFYSTPSARGICAARILTNTADARLVALDALTGRLCPEFGVRGVVDLRTGMGKVIKGYYYVTSAPTIVRGKIVVGGWVSDGQYWGEPSGVVRAFDAVSGALAWAWDMGRPERNGAPAPGETYTHSTPNSWAPMSADDSLGLVYVPTGNATPDYYGAQRRPFDDKYSSSVVALDAVTGRPRWSFQTTHHDLWDYDVGSQPLLLDVNSSGKVAPALIQLTKRGEIFLLDRRNGRPLAEVQERAVPQRGAAPGERLSPTQPFSIGMPSLKGPDLEEADMWGVTPLDQLYCRIKFRQARYDGPLTPPGVTSAIFFPGYMGGSNWGSGTVDPVRNTLITVSNRFATYSRLIPRREAAKMGIVPLIDGSKSEGAGPWAQAHTPFAAAAVPFMSPIGVPCQRPPYGVITAIDLNTRRILWQHPLGVARENGPLLVGSRLPFLLGTPASGGAISTRGGLVFVGASIDRYFRAIDVQTGATLWRSNLPAAGMATPMTYLGPRSRRQFVVIAAGGNPKLGLPSSDSIIAYALPLRSVR
jgi:quinoprotein glucose dehydrogenase